ncbi:hypothetical protein LXA43DRAFT_1046774 [Ganoderma leucocontextum]|nr:hypothetical protein LXA43DRAFT_1046774 [Ganoderma leucocontextum]
MYAPVILGASRVRVLCVGLVPLTFIYHCQSSVRMRHVDDHEASETRTRMDSVAGPPTVECMLEQKYDYATQLSRDNNTRHTTTACDYDTYIFGRF